MASVDFSSGQRIGPAKTVLTRCSLNSNEVTTPKLPPPPRIAQKRSSFFFELAVTKLPSAVTMSAERRLSHDSPHLRVRCPMPPPRVRPAIPVVETKPPGVASPNVWVAWSTSHQVHP